MPPDDLAAPAPPLPRWGLGDAVAGFLVGIVAASIVTTVWLLAADAAPAEVPPLWVDALAQIGLWVGLLGAPVVASRTKGHGRLAEDFGLRMARSDVPRGLAAGVVCQWALIPLLYVLVMERLFPGEHDLSGPARELTERATGIGLLLLVLVVGLGAPLVEELFFRGLLLRSLERRWGTRVAWLGSSVVFGLAHFQVWQFPALLLFGFVLAWLVHRSGRLGPAIVAHVVFNATAVVGLLSGGG